MYAWIHNKLQQKGPQMSKSSIHNMSTFELARWCSLLEAVNLVVDECEKRGEEFDDKKISPLDLVNYIEGTCDAFARDIEAEHKSKQDKIKILELCGA